MQRATGDMASAAHGYYPVRKLATSGCKGSWICSWVRKDLGQTRVLFWRV